ncbi:MAG: Sec-independent protein translocase subunit TatA [Lysobacteraceae bacterium]
MGSFSIWHWLIVLVIVLVVFGTKRLTGGAKDIGNAVKEFKKGMRDEDKSDATPEALPPPVLRPVDPTIHATAIPDPEAVQRPDPDAQRRDQ